MKNTNRVKIILLAVVGLFLIFPGLSLAADTSWTPGWTSAECVKAGGKWLPEGGKTSGDFCYTKQDIN
ncbi:MAG: hypothetical protein AAB731_02915, partial [Patescibacteria group bacterium]